MDRIYSTGTKLYVDSAKLLLKIDVLRSPLQVRLTVPCVSKHLPPRVPDHLSHLYVQRVPIECQRTIRLHRQAEIPQRHSMQPKQLQVDSRSGDSLDLFESVRIFIGEKSLWQEILETVNLVEPLFENSANKFLSPPAANLKGHGADRTDAQGATHPRYAPGQGRLDTHHSLLK